MPFASSFQPLRRAPFTATVLAAAATLSLSACGGGDSGTPAAQIDTVVVIYAENRSFDNLFGLFPGANGIANALKDPAATHSWTVTASPLWPRCQRYGMPQRKCRRLGVRVVAAEQAVPDQRRPARRCAGQAWT